MAELFVLMVVARLVAWVWQPRLFRRGEGVRRLLVAGTGASAYAFDRFIADRPWLGYAVAGHLAVLDGATESGFVGGLRLTGWSWGGLPQLPAALKASGAGEVIVTLDYDEHERLPQVLAALHAAAVPFCVVPAMFEHATAAPRRSAWTVSRRCIW